MTNLPQIQPHDTLIQAVNARELHTFLQVQTKLAQAQLKIAHYDFVVERHELINAGQVGGKVGISAVALNRLLDEFGVYNKSVKRNGRTFNHWFISKDLGVMRQTTTGHEQALFTRKGEAWVIEKLANEGAI